MELWVITKVMGSGIFFFLRGYDDKHRIDMMWRKRK